MRSVKSTTLKKTNALEEVCPGLNVQNSMLNVTRKLIRLKGSSVNLYKFFIACSLQLLALSFLSAQDNSPYSRYGIGDLHPNSNILNRGMGGISVGYADPLSVNFTNPASYSSFKTFLEERSKKASSGRVILDAGINFDNRSLREANNADRFTSPNTYFSYLQLGIPVKDNLGISFGLRPVSKINYSIVRRERLYDPVTTLPIDSAATEFIGEGGAFLVSTGAGWAIKNFSIGINAGYLFGKKDYSSKRTLINDSVAYNRSNHQTKTSFGDLFFSGGIQYKAELNTKTVLRIGLEGNLKQDLNARRDIIRETFTRSSDLGDLRLDSVTEQLDEKGIIVYPGGFSAGFTVERQADDKKGGWLIGMDFSQTAWDDYRFYGSSDPVQNNWRLKIGGQLKPALKEVKYKNYISYRAGFFIGQDYVYLGKKLPEYGISFGMGLPILNLKDPQRRFRTQYTTINLALEYIKRGNNDNVLSENLFRISAGFSLSDLWFVKRKYD